MSRPRQPLDRTLDPAPLLAVIDQRARGDRFIESPRGLRVCAPATWCARSGVATDQQYRRWVRGQRLSIILADRTAVALGLHPSEVWGDEWWALDPGRSVA